MWLLKWHQSKSFGVRVPAPVSPLSWQPSGGLGRLMRSPECKQKWVTYKRDLTLADYHNHRTWCPNLRVVVQHWEEFHNRLLILPIESVVLGFGFEVWVFSAASDSSSSGATQTESLELPDWFEVLEEPDLMEFQVCLSFRFQLGTLGTSQQVLQPSQTGARVPGNWEEQRLLMSPIWQLFIPPQRH